MDAGSGSLLLVVTTLTAVLALAATALCAYAVYTFRRIALANQQEQKRILQEHKKYLLHRVEQMRKLDEELRFRELLRKCRIRELPLASIFPGIEDVTVPLGAINEETGHGNQAELLYLVAVATHLKSKRIFEFGTYMGRTTYHLALATPETEVTTIDLPDELTPRPGHQTGAYFRGSDRERHIHQLRCDSKLLDTAPYRKRMDFVWVDADHSYEGVKSDTLKALEMLAPGGVILWHDFAAKSPGVVEFFAEFTQTRPVFRILNTSILVHIDGVDPMTFEPHPLRVTKANIHEFKDFGTAARPAA